MILDYALGYDGVDYHRLNLVNWLGEDRFKGVMDATYWIIGSSAVLAAAACLSVVWVLLRCVLRLRWPGFPTSFRQVVGAVFAVWGLMLVLGALIAAPWSDKSRWTNKLALQAPSHGPASPSASGAPSPLISDLARQVGDDGTLVAVTISGGGSRAAYFAAAVLERLSKVKWPGPNGDSLIEHVNLVSSVSGGSLAAAYFVVNGPGRSNPGPQALADFFERFKQAMATNLELPALRDLIDPRNTLTMLTLERPMAESVANVMDDVVTGGQGTKIAELQRHANGGLVDNLGLLTLYSLLLDPDLYRLTHGRLRRIIVLTIDSETQSIHPGLLAGLEGLSTWSGEALHRFVIPAMIRSAYQRELGDVLEDEVWKDFSPPSPIFISYGECNGRDIATRFRLSEPDREAVQQTAEVCVLDAGIKNWKRSLRHRLNAQARSTMVDSPQPI